MSPGVLAAAYDAVTGVLDGLAPVDWDRPTRAEGWTVRDLTFHLLLDAQRALVTLASPGERAPDRDRYDYWSAFHPASGDGGAAHADFVRRAAAAYGERALLAVWRDTAPAAGHAVAVADPADLVATQGHVLTVADLASTLVLEASVHHLDLVLDLPDAAGPPAAALAETRHVLDVLAPAPFPAPWPDERVALLGTGRVLPDDAERAALGDAADRLPLLG
ncbi:maleylpyruvate isomerase N-terminal domain-containing protein [uncultured Nocardioides sp.]|uniref:maleylpyruvate isomerase N-terminal domain-containing protein n=1 Tax=uncultured Nocardioides sp. TaxID=198441 RepID=UPI0026295456|nr:maleylpyruvate isomerase N-terminal domain-containing protein [uncultured Nocardioides sp.]